jgi:tetratricopeptide (TPR) repeat protein
VDARETWQALQARLTNARAAFDLGDRTRALDEVNAALTIDPNYLAAHALRDRIIATPAGVAPSGPASPAAPAQPCMPAAAVPDSAPAMPTLQSMNEGYAKFEQRAKRRRVDRRLDAARQALESGRLKAAASALDEVIELDPNLPDLRELTARFDDLRRQAARHRGPTVVAAGVFVVSILGASWLHESTSLISRPMIAGVPPLSTPTSFGAATPDPIAVATAGGRDTIPEVLPPLLAAEPADVRALVDPAIALPAIETLELTPAMPSTPPMPPAMPPVVPAPRGIGAVQETSFNAPAAPVEVIAAAVPPPAPPMVEIAADDNQLVKQALQRYRVAYEGLDARSAQAVWPAVNQAALARAFDGLESQSLTFDACDVRVRGEVATAICQGSARYVPKIGSREPRTEPRVWNFSLHKAGGDWKIESARAER